MTQENRNSNSDNPYHPDIILFLVLIPLISAFNYYLTYSDIKLGWFLVFTFSIDTVQGYIALWAVRSLILFFDRKIPYEENFAKRITIQLISTVVVGILIISVLTELVSVIVRGKFAPSSFYLIDLFIISIWFFVINGIYVGLYYYNLWRASERRLADETRLKAEGIVVQQGKQNIRLDFSEVAKIYIDSDYAVLCTVNGKKYYLGQSLDKTEKILPVSFFFRVNRQVILHRQVITGFTRSENGKLLIALKTEDVPDEIVISRLKAPAFKVWFQAST